MQVMSTSIIKSLSSGRFLNWEVLDATGTAGGCLWCGTKEV